MKMYAYECKECGEQFDSNIPPDDGITCTCTDCGATRCPHCERWFQA
jgi:predicted nucleic acid-binding Zn ribbon protein